MTTPSRAWLSLLAILFFGVTLVEARDLTFEERVKAQEALERIYYSHQIGTKRTFEEAVPRAVLESKVRTYLKQSVVLEKIWNTPVTGQMLRAETERMARQTRMPDRLRQLFAALGDDPFVVQECLARPALVDRLVRNFFAYETTIHTGSRKESEALRKDLVSGRIDPSTEHPKRTLTDLVRVDAAKRDRSGAIGRVAPGPSGHLSRLELEPDEFDLYRSRFPDRVSEVGPVIEDREAFVIHVVLEQTEDDMRLATFAVPKVDWDTWWRSVEGRLHEKSVHAADPVDSHLSVPRPAEREVSPGSDCLPDDTWDNGSLDDWPEALSQHSAVWTGTLMIVWGGGSNTGGRYDPATDTWAANSMANAPSPRSGHTAVWTGSQMIVWGGSGVCSTAGTGARYDPTSDTWTPTSTKNAPSLRIGHSAVWTGSEMIVWGGLCTSGALNDGARYDPALDRWASISQVDAPAPRDGHTAVWTGSLMVVWGGSGGGSYLNTGGRYDPVADVWTPTSMTGVPSSRLLETAVWTGSVMIVWGGYDGFTTYLNTGGRYDPAVDSWTPTSTTDATPRGSHTAVWTGSQMVVWGGFGSPSNTGGRYDPVTDTWTSTSTTNAPSPRSGHSAVWTGNLMVVWGGISGGSALSTGGRYDPTADTWTPTADTTAPSARNSHSAVWTGSQMVVWGGEYFSQQNTGGRYDPATDIWMPTSTTNAPSRRSDHSAVWTGRHVVVWGGDCGSGGLDTGGRYDPVADTWTATSTMDAPSPRCEHTAVWTGSTMVVWGGFDFTRLGTGGRYDPATDTWASTSTTNAPSPRSNHSAVWTGSLMVVWGGVSDGSAQNTLSTGGRYDPTADTWAPTSDQNAPWPRSGHTAVWTGSQMVVWGGLYFSELNTGGRYDPAADAWTDTSTMNAPSARFSHTAAWTGSLMVIWGGQNSLSSSLSTGGRYDPTTDAWAATSMAGAPSRRSHHTTVWTGSVMVVWGGSELRTGGSYALGHSVDDDLDGFSECQGDCNDGNPVVHPGVAEVCDGLDNNCDGVTDNASVPVGTPLLAAELSGGATHLSWSPVGQATGYDLVRGDLSMLVSSKGDFASATEACLADNLGGTSLDVADPPMVGAGFWYLTRAINCGGHGTYDSGGSGQVGSRDGEINASPSSCP